MPRDAEAWLAERGIVREPLHIKHAPADPPSRDPVAGTQALAAASGQPMTPAITPREAVALAQQAQADRELAVADAASVDDRREPRLEDDVSQALAFIRRSTSATPQSEGRLRSKLRDRGWSAAVVDLALDRARDQRLVDDELMAAALVDERRAKGHAPARIRRDLRARGFDDQVVDRHLAAAEAEDPEAAAFGLARSRAAGLSGVAAETAFRRVAAYVARRGYPDGLARKVAREAVFSEREDQRIAGR